MNCAVCVWGNEQRCVCVRQWTAMCVCETMNSDVSVWDNEQRCVCVRQWTVLCVCEAMNSDVCVWDNEQRCVCVRQWTAMCLCETMKWQGLPVRHRIQYKISTICFSFLSGKSPQYHCGFTQPYTPTRKPRSASDIPTFVVPRVNTKRVGQRSFSYSGPSVWINLTRWVCRSSPSSLLWSLLKPFLKLCLTCQSSLQPSLSSVSVCVCVWGWGVGGCVSVAIVKCTAVPVCVEDGRCTNVLFFFLSFFKSASGLCHYLPSKKHHPNHKTVFEGGG